MDDYLIEQAASHVIELMGAVGVTGGKPVFLVGGSEGDRSRVIAQCAHLSGTSVCQVGIALTSALLAQADQSFVGNRLSTILNDILPTGTKTAFLDHVEVLFSAPLNSNAVEVLCQLARRRTVCVNWPGRIDNKRLRYAAYGHPECLDEDATRVLAIDVSKIER